MKIIVAGFPAAAIEIAVFKGQDADGPIHSVNVGYNDFYSTLNNLIEEYNPDEIIFYGPTAYTGGLAVKVRELISPDIDLTILPNDNEEIDEEELAEEAMEGEE